MSTELDLNKFMTATVSDGGVTIEDEQHGEVRLGGDVLERIYRQYLEERDAAPSVRVLED